MLAGGLLVSLLEYFVRIKLPGHGSDLAARALWMQKWAGFFRDTFRLRVSYEGRPPDQGVLASNHVSYLDILAYASRQPLVFVSKAEVKYWPLIGWATTAAGSLYINRQQRSDVKRLGAQFASIVEARILIAMFPEGTSTGGDEVLPFRSSLLEPAAAHGWPVTPCWVGYHLDEGSASEEVCYWGDMTFATHVLNLLTKKQVHAIVAYGDPLPPGADRKEMAKRLRAHVSELARAHGRTLKNQNDLNYAHQNRG